VGPRGVKRPGRNWELGKGFPFAHDESRARFLAPCGGFYAELTSFDRFEEVAEDSVYSRVPDSWQVLVTGFRKFDDLLRMILDLSQSEWARVCEYPEGERSAGAVPISPA